jgi:hypothetical protein
MRCIPYELYVPEMHAHEVYAYEMHIRVSGSEDPVRPPDLNSSVKSLQ